MKLEDHARRSVTRRLIRRYKVSIIIERKATVTDGAGGVTKGATTFMPAKDRYFAPFAAAPILGVDALGRRVEERLVLVSVVGDDILAGDRFTVGTKSYEITQVIQDGPELIAEVTRVHSG